MRDNKKSKTRVAERKYKEGTIKTGGEGKCKWERGMGRWREKDRKKKKDRATDGKM